MNLLLINKNSASAMKIFGVGVNSFGQLGIGHQKREYSFLPVEFGCCKSDQLDPYIVLDIQCGAQLTVVLTRDGKVLLCGTLNGSVFPTLTPIEIALPVKCVQIACGRKHVLALMERGIVLSWGVGYFGQLGHGDDCSWETPKIIAALEHKRIGSTARLIACGGSHSGVLLENGQVYMWGLNRSGQCGTTSKTDSILQPRPINVCEIGSLSIVDLVCGRSHSALRTDTGRVFTWGEGSFGRLGISDTRKQIPHPVEIPLFRSNPVHSLACGDFHMLALCTNHSVFSWGIGHDGQNGHAILANVRTPRKIEYFDTLKVVQISCGALWSLAVTSAGELYCWGYGDGGWLFLGPNKYLPMIDQDALPVPSQLTETHIQSFDSRYNVTSPYKVNALATDWHVEKVCAGGGHTITFCREKISSSKDESRDKLLSRDEGKNEAGTQEIVNENFSFSNDIASNIIIEESQLISWSRHKKLHELTNALIRGANVNYQDSAGNTALIVACQNGHSSVSQLLVRYGANLNLANNKGNTALHYCFNYGYEDIGNYLIKQGADEFQTNKEGLTCYEGLTKSDLDLL